MLALAVLVGAAVFQVRRRGDAAAGHLAGPHGADAGQDRAQQVVPDTARARDVPVFIAGLGAVTPTHSVTVRTRVDGQLMRLAFKEGQLVDEGDVLAEIDPRPFQVQLEQAQGQLLRDRALLTNARLDLQRYRTLFAQDSVAKQTLDTQAALVRQYEGIVKTDEGAVASAELNLTYSRITSPVAGRVGLRQVDPGNIVHAADSTGIVIVNSLRPITVIFSVPEDRVPDILARLEAHQTLPVDAYDRGDQRLLARGTLATVDNQIDPTTGTARLRADFPNHDFKLFPQQFVNARLRIDVLRDATVVATAAIQHGVQGPFVYVLQPDDTVRVQPVSLGPTDADDTVVTRGVSVGERVVVEGADKLTDGAHVRVQAHAAPGLGVGGSGQGGTDGGR
ncbi:MdtA/MuxA family multidrug efflux RND transporter periplasmic adaptor subunit [Myxococcus sp. K38C18041901]|uniref:MdtA/MuxA family multidrug efflux RND transporter periplasmic adaptor subunit n=1 Tax=Myxococcus guangdongensis TaxID=2906760 RepID=UPI0020A7AA52|nr:MdtA/MuxA family multidrug efflux RND transporter periplasmic adaptor subunit [Myxococcus guangdongensis]MCP3060801.1 MdtA/MuxA family multidrug efflux RND transporter periplasmic adaptor subunit [Myxococcus guangdongensis]